MIVEDRPALRGPFNETDIRIIMSDYVFACRATATPPALKNYFSGEVRRRP